MGSVTVTPKTAVLGMKKVEQNEKMDSNTAAVPADDKLGSDNSGQRELDEATTSAKRNI